MAKIPVIMDVDTGLDDAMAMLLASRSDKIEIRGITTVFGNQSAERTAENTLKICSLLGINVPVAKGAEKGFLEKKIDYSSGLEMMVHGADGLGGRGGELDEPQRPLEELTACDLMAKILQESEEPVVIVATAPLTNVATFLLAYPELRQKIRCIAFMGGAIFGGNIKPTVEANIGHDIEAAAVVLESNVPKVMFPLDATMNVYLARAERIAMKQTGRVGAFLSDALEGYEEIYGRLAAIPGAVLHDSVPVAWLIDPDTAELRDLCVRIELNGELTRGCTVTDTMGRFGTPNMKVAVHADRDKIIQMHFDALKKQTR